MQSRLGFQEVTLLYDCLDALPITAIKIFGCDPLYLANDARHLRACFERLPYETAPFSGPQSSDELPYMAQDQARKILQ